jgi:putative endopeptidase
MSPSPRKAAPIGIAVALGLLSLAADAAPVFAPNSWGFDASAMDSSVRPGDGFDRYANGAWQARTPIPEDRQSYSVAAYNVERIEWQLHILLEESSARAPVRPSDTPGKIGAFYASFMNRQRIEALGVRPMSPDLARIRAVASREDLARLMAVSNASYFGSVVFAQVFPDLKEPSRNSAYLGQPSLALPDRDYYLQPDFAETRTAYQAYLVRMLRLAGWPEPEANAKAILAFETAVAQASWSAADQRDVSRLYNPRSLAQLEAEAPGFPWKEFLKSANLPDKVIVAEPDALSKIAAIYAATPLETLKAWQAFSLADNAAYYLPKAFSDAWFDFHKKTLLGVETQPVRWKRAVHAVSGGDYLYGERSEIFGSMGWAVGEAYVARYFPPNAKSAVESLVANLKAAFKARIEAADWMSPPTKAVALRKLAALRVKVGYPDRPVRDYGPVRIDRGDLYGNARRVAEFEWRLQTASAGRPVDTNQWAMTPQTVDAYNGGPSNEIAFPAASLQAPDFSPDADMAVNYAGIGGAIGHEITHSFDDQGRMLDETGALRDWWTPVDAEAYKAIAARLGAQYSLFEPLPGLHVNGELTMGENIADLVGLEIALDAYHRALEGRPAPILDGLTGDQRFFLAYAQSWRGKAREAALRRQIATDPHAPRRYRIDGVVRNMDRWYDAFGIQPGQALYLPPEKRVRFW